MANCAIVAAICALGLTSSDALFFLPSVILFPYAVTLAVSQYGGTFRRSYAGSGWAVFLLLPIVLGTTMLFSFYLVDAFLHGFASGFVYVAFVGGVATATVGRYTLENWYWHLDLKHAQEEQLKWNGPQGVTLMDLMLLMLVISMVCGVVGYAVRKPRKPGSGSVRQDIEASFYRLRPHLEA